MPRKNASNGQYRKYENYDLYEPPKKRKRKRSHALINILVAILVVAVGGTALIFAMESKLHSASDPFGWQTASSEVDDIVLENEEITITKDELIRVDPNDLSANRELDEEIKNVLLLGTDARSNKGNGLTDTIMILSINQNTKAVKLASIVRDTWVTIPGRSKGSKINAANVYGGPNLAMKTVNEVFGMNIDDYVMVNFQGLISIIDAIGGIDLDITGPERQQVNVNLDGYRGDLEAAGQSFDINTFAPLQTYGPNTHVNGQQALAYSRIRKIDSDYARAERQRKVLMAIGEKVKQGNVFQIAGLVTKVFPHVSTSMQINEIISLSSMAFTIDMGAIEQIQIPMEGTFEAGMYGNVWCIKPDFDKNKQILHDYIYGPNASEMASIAETSAD